MKIENVYKCLRCGKIITEIKTLEDMLGLNEPTHYCDLINDKQIGMLQQVGFNIIEY